MLGSVVDSLTRVCVEVMGELVWSAAAAGELRH